MFFTRAEYPISHW